jgi:hypothetical protein
MPTIIDIITFKADYSRDFSKDLKFDFGIKSSSVFSDNDVKLSSGPIENMEPDAELSNHFQYTEEVRAIYANIVSKFSGIDVQAGLRAEHTHSVGKSLTVDQRVERDYLNLFPSLFLKRNLSPKQNLTFSYGYRIDRPNYPSLNPARSYLDPYTFSRGNAYLKPQYTHTIEFKHGFDNKLFTSVAANYVSDYVFYIVQPVDAQTAERTPDNIGTSRVYNLNVSYPIDFLKGWTFQTNFTGTYSILKYLYMGESLIVEQFSGRFNGSNSIVLGKDWTAEISGWLNTPATNTIFVSPWLGSMDIGVQKSIKSKLKIRFSAQDVFKTNKWVGRGHASGYNQNARISFDTRIFMLNLTYSFGNQKMKAERQRKTSSDEEMQRTN